MSLKKLTVLAGILGFVAGLLLNDFVLLPAIGWGVAGFLGFGIVIAVVSSIRERIAKRKTSVSAK